MGARKNRVTCYAGYDQRHVKYVKINQSRQLALDGVVDTDMDYTSNDSGSSATHYLLFSFFSYFILLHEKFLLFDWLRAVVYQPNLKYLHVKITNLLRIVV